MRIMNIRWVVFLFFSLVPIHSYAQRLITAEGTHTFVAPSSMSPNEAKSKAVELARVQVIADEFGTIVDMTNLTEVSNMNGKSSVDMLSIGYSDVRGEWIEDVQNPVFSMTFNDDFSYQVTATVKGKIREIISADIDFKAKVLRNGEEDCFEGYDFNSNDQLFMSFLSPVDGYLAVYLYDGEEQVYRLLPYKYQEEGYFQIRRNKKYVLFSPRQIIYDMPSYQVDELILNAASPKEVNMLYILFSPNKFIKAMDSDGDGLPSLDHKSFQQWLIKCRNRDKEMIVDRKTITITQ